MRLLEQVPVGWLTACLKPAHCTHSVTQMLFTSPAPAHAAPLHPASSSRAVAAAAAAGIFEVAVQHIVIVQVGHSCCDVSQQ